MKESIIYTIVGCPYCKRAKSILTEQRVPFREIVGQFGTPEMDALIKKTGQDTVPQIFLAGHFIGGCSDLEKIVREDGLKKYLE